MYFKIDHRKKLESLSKEQNRQGPLVETFFLLGYGGD